MGPRRGVLKTAMEHYLCARSRTADELLGTAEAEEGRHRKRLAALAPNPLLDLPLGARLPLLPGSSRLFYSTHLGKQLYQPSSGFDLGDPFCQIMAASLHSPPWCSYYKRTDSLRRGRRASDVGSESPRLLEKPVARRQEASLLPEGGDTCHFGEWLSQQGPDLHDAEGQARNRELDMINKELEEIKTTREEKHHLQWAEGENKHHGHNQKKQLNLRQKMEEAWKKKEMLLLLKIGADVREELRAEQLRRKSRPEKAPRRQMKLEKEAAVRLRTLCAEGYPSEEADSHGKVWGAYACSRPSGNGKKTSLPPVASQQPFEPTANNLKKKRARFQKRRTEDLNSKIQHIMTWFLAEVTSILYPAVTKYEETARAKPPATADGPVLSSENSSSCNEELFGSLPPSRTKRVFFPGSEGKPTSSPADHKTVPEGKLSQTSPFTPLTRSTRVSLESEFCKGNIHKRKTPPSQTKNALSFQRKVMSMGGAGEFPSKNFETERFPFIPTYFTFESTANDANPQHCLSGGDIPSAVSQSLPKDSVFKKLLEQQRGTEANVTDNLKMLQVAENVVKDVFMRVQDLDHSVRILKKAPIEISERLFCSKFKRTEPPGTFQKDFQKEIGLVAREIVAIVFDNFHKCLASSISTAPGSTSRVSKSEKKKGAQSDSPVYDRHISLASIDKMAKATVESVIFTLESFVAFQFKHDFKCKFSEIVKLPVENRSGAQHKPFLRPLSTQVAKEIEVSFEHTVPGTTSKRTLPTLEPFHSFPDLSRVSSMITRESIQNAICQVQRLHSELSIYAKIAVTKILEIIKWKPEKEPSHRETSPFSDVSEENILASQLTGAILEQCSQNLMEITSESKFENPRMEKPGRAFGNNKTPNQGVTRLGGMKMSAKKLKADLRETFPPISVPDMMINSEEKTEMWKDIPRNLPTLQRRKFSARETSTASERIRKSIFSVTAPKPRFSRPAPESTRTLSSRMTLPPIGRQFARKSFCKIDTKKSPKGEAMHRGEEDGECLPSREAERQATQSQDGVSSAAFLKEMCSELLSKLIMSSHTRDTQDRKTEVTEPSQVVTNIIDSMLNECSKSHVKEPSPQEDPDPPPQVSTLATKIIHSSLCDILKESGSEASDYTAIKSDHSASVETLAASVRREIIDYQFQGPLAKASSSTVVKPLESGLIADEVSQKDNKPSTQCQTVRVPHGFLEDVITKLLLKMLPEHSDVSSSAETENQIAEFDFIHMTLVSKVRTEISKEQNRIIQYVKDLHQDGDSVIPAVVESVYHKLLPQFGSQLTMQKCLKSGCTILSEAIADLVLTEVSENHVQTLFSGELTADQCAGADSVVEDMLRDLTEPSAHPNPVTSDVGEFSSLIIEELSYKLLHKLLSIFPTVEMDEQNPSSVKHLTSKIMNSLKALLSKNQLKISDSSNEPDSLQEDDSRASGEAAGPVYTHILKHSDSDISIHKDLTNPNDVLANRVASLVLGNPSKHEIQLTSLEEPPPTFPLMLEAVNIFKKILTSTELPKPPLASHSPVLPVMFVEEILSRFLSKILKPTHSRSSERSLSKTEVNEVAGKLKESMEKLMFQNKISFVEGAGDVANSEHNETLNQVAHAIYSNVLQKSGSQQDFYDSVTSSRTNFPQQVASIIINEISHCHLARAFKGSAPMVSQSAMELNRIVERVHAHVSLHTLPEPRCSREPLGDENANEQPTEPRLPINIIPYTGNSALEIDPAIVPDQLAVISIETEPLEELKKACSAFAGLSLTDLRRATVAGNSPAAKASIAEERKKKERRPSLCAAGRLDVRPKELTSRNSFWDMLKPDLAKVEILKDVKNQQDLIRRLVARDIEAEAGQQQEEEAAFENILKVESSLIFESRSRPGTAGREGAASARPSKQQRYESEASLPAVRPSTSSQKKFLSLSKCCQALSNSIPEDIEDIVREIKDDQDQLSRLPSASTRDPPIATPRPGKEAQDQGAKDTAATHGPLPDSEQNLIGSASSTDVSALNKDSTCLRGSAGETAPVPVAQDKGTYDTMHEARDTEDTSAIFELVSPYEDVGQEDSPLQEKTVAAAASDSSVPRQRPSSLFKKVPAALSRVFSRTSAASAAAPERA
ncbi:uncharacterized protein LOC102446450 [Pelodiscus sinensis]|uniref:uncharacterized protein LOC102446450 n=1 Tax=Pelodiscus sinensis TaxID=13735 RepID=UPI003F6C8E6A